MYYIWHDYPYDTSNPPPIRKMLEMIVERIDLKRNCIGILTKYNIPSSVETKYIKRVVAKYDFYYNYFARSPYWKNAKTLKTS